MEKWMLDRVLCFSVGVLAVDCRFNGFKVIHFFLLHLPGLELEMPLIQSPEFLTSTSKTSILLTVLVVYLPCERKHLIYKMIGLEMNDWKKIGLGLTGFGVFFSCLGIMMFFDKGLLAIGNVGFFQSSSILFISGVVMTIGVKPSLQFFLKTSNLKVFSAHQSSLSGTISFGIGFFFVIIGWPVIGMAAEAYGFIILFSGFWPTLSVFMQKIPIIGWVFQQPYIRSVCFPCPRSIGCKEKVIDARRIMSRLKDSKNDATILNKLHEGNNELKESNMQSSWHIKEP
ncbi:Got1-like vescicle transport protein [Artemisia annua]|uniref:Got1-like vescicle transport protein n=1 Tax=Artemisia annua TaxID=35608 RepID=A0A2U1QG05_ARTAN|nr:Got1-like vescicle transport protein [Artemisia annua]